MLCIEQNQLIEDAATGSANLFDLLLKYHKPVIRPMNNQGEIVNRPSQIYFDGEVKDDYFDIKIGGQSQFVASGNGKSQ
jgi:trans-2,3-dihydro-3-hydroxyanthranilate isomerase